MTAIEVINKYNRQLLLMQKTAIITVKSVITDAVSIEILS